MTNYLSTISQKIENYFIANVKCKKFAVTYVVYNEEKILRYFDNKVEAIDFGGAEPARAIRAVARSARSYCKPKLHSRGVSLFIDVV